MNWLYSLFGWDAWLVIGIVLFTIAMLIAALMRDEIREGITDLFNARNARRVEYKDWKPGDTEDDESGKP